MQKCLLPCVLSLALGSVDARAEGVETEVDLLEMRVGVGDDHFVFDTTLTGGGDSYGFAFKVEGGSNVGPRIDDVTVRRVLSPNSRFNRHDRP